MNYSTEEEEKEANIFAMQLLVPETLLMNKLFELYPERTLPLYDIEDPIVKLAKVFDVSPIVMALRLADIGVLKI